MTPLYEYTGRYSGTITVRAKDFDDAAEKMEALLPHDAELDKSSLEQAGLAAED